MPEALLPYGRSTLPVELPAGAEVTLVAKRPVAPLADPYAAVGRALDGDGTSPSLTELARGRRSACVVICDITRPVPNGLFLRPVVERIVAGGVPLDQVTVLVATGLHRPNVDAELLELVGDPWVLENVRVENHDARDASRLVDLGRTRTRGTPVSINARLVEADLRVVTGLVEPHFMAGWSGGRKVVAPGVAGADTIRTFHSYAFMADPRATQCNLVGNPLHEEQLEIVAMLGEVHALNTVLDDERRLLDVTFGEVRASHAAAVAFAEGVAQVELGRRFSTVVTSAGGYPLDKTYYQTVKGMVTPLDVLAPGGTLIIASECSEGLGSPAYAAAQGRLVAAGADAFLADLAGRRLAHVDEWQTQMQLRSQHAARVELFTTGLSEAELGLTAVERVHDVGTAIAASVRRSGDPAVAVIPDGPYVVPVVAR